MVGDSTTVLLYKLARGGLALLITHPDYVDAGPVAAAYERFLDHFAADEGVWRALPGQVAAWWRRRADSAIEVDGRGWRVVGPAAGEASIVFASPPPAAGQVPAPGPAAHTVGEPTA